MFEHIPVLLDETITGLNIKPDGVYVDGTSGGGGHSLEIENKLTSGMLFCFDKDPDAISFLNEKFKSFKNVTVVNSDFSEVKNVLRGFNIFEIDGILLDLGVSSHQIDSNDRGFSYSKDSFLDMRMSQNGISAFDVVNNYSQEQLAFIFRSYGEEKYAFFIAKKIVKKREDKEIETTGQLVDIIKSALPSAVLRKSKNPARKIFQALRIEVNQEIESLKKAIDDGFDILKPDGRFCVITFHSIEDRIVKKSFVNFTKGCCCPPSFPICICNEKPKAKIINKKPFVASSNEIANNSRSRSAKLRILEKI